MKSCATTLLQSERATSSIKYARGGLGAEDPAYDTTTTTAHLPDEITQAVTSAIYCLVTTNTTTATINRAFLARPPANQIPATRLVLIISCLRQAARRQGLKKHIGKAYTTRLSSSAIHRIKPHGGQNVCWRARNKQSRHTQPSTSTSIHITTLAWRN